MKESMLPISEKKRLAHIDLLRGFSVLGIFLVNMPFFHMPLLYVDGYDVWNKGLDRWLFMLSEILARNSLYPLFAFLFGFGAVILYERSLDKGISFIRLYSRRMLGLLLIGCIHAFLIWHGDILITYALLGFIFLLFYQFKGKTLLIIGSLLYAIPVVMISIVIILLSLIASQELSIASTTDYRMVDQSQTIYQSGSFIEITEQRFQDWYVVNNPVGMILYIFLILPFILLGAGFAKLRWLHKPALHKRKLLIMAVTCSVLGILIKTIPFFTEYYHATMFIQYELGGPLLTFAYITGLTLLFQKKSILHLFYPLTNIGKMSMSNYLFQSVICTFIFYSYGLGLYGQISYTLSVLLIFIIYGLQLALSVLWLKYFQFGPMEYVWRVLTYGKKTNMKRLTDVGVRDYEA